MHFPNTQEHYKNMHKEVSLQQCLTTFKVKVF
jgi:hypothetical protein